MHCVVLLWAGLLVGEVHDYTRPLDAKKLDQAALDAEKVGNAKALKREDDGLRATVAPGEADTGWRTPQALRIGGDFTITARFVVRKLPKPAQEDGAAVGLAIATQNLDQPDATLVRLIEPTGADVYRSIEKEGNAPQGMQPGMEPGMPVRVMRAGAPQPGEKPQKPPRKTFRAKGQEFRLELRREGQTVRYYVRDGESDTPRYVGHAQLGPGDVNGVKLFASNRNGAEAVDVVFRDLIVHADRISGLGTEVRTVYGQVVHGSPIALEDGKLAIGEAAPSAPGPAQSGPTPAPAAAATPGAARVMVAAPAGAVVVAAAPVAAPAVAPAPAPAPAVAKPAEAKAAPAEKKDDQKPGEKKDDKAPAEPPKPKIKTKLPLDELESIAFESADTLSARFVGQVNLDFTMSRPKDEKEEKASADDVLAPPPGTVAPKKIPKLDPRPNGIRDLHVALSGLRSAPIKQVTVNGQTDKGQAAWRLDTADSRDWPLVLRRAGTESWADLFLEPPEGDLRDKDLTINVTYQDGQSGNATIKADAKTDPKLAFDPKAPAPSFDARVYLVHDEQLFGTIERLDGESLGLRTPWGDALKVPLAYVAGIYMGLPEHKETSESFERRLRSRGTEDLLLARSKDGEVVAIPGIAEGTEGEKLQFQFQEKTRTLPLKQVEGLVLAARPEPKRPDGVRPTFSMAGGLVVSGAWKALDTKTWKIETDWGQALNLPAAGVRSVRCRGGDMAYLSDLEPSRVEQTPFFGRQPPWRKDVNLAGAPLKMDGRTYQRGLAVHARTVLAYDLAGRYATFEALVGFDDAAKRLGRVDCRVLADGKELYANRDLRADAPPVALSLPVAGVNQLRLVVDFGPDEDTGDRVIWANARLFRHPAPGDKGRDESQAKRSGE